MSRTLWNVITSEVIVFLPCHCHFKRLYLRASHFGSRVCCAFIFVEKWIDCFSAHFVLYACSIIMLLYFILPVITNSKLILLLFYFIMYDVLSLTFNHSFRLLKCAFLRTYSTFLFDSSCVLFFLTSFLFYSGSNICKFHLMVNRPLKRVSYKRIVPFITTFKLKLLQL